MYRFFHDSVVLVVRLCFKMAEVVQQVLPDNQLGLVETQQYKDTLEDQSQEVQVVAPAQPSPTTPASSVEDALFQKMPAVEGMSWQQLKMAEKGHQYCQHCKMVVEVGSQQVIKKKHTKILHAANAITL